MPCLSRVRSSPFFFEPKHILHGSSTSSTFFVKSRLKNILLESKTVEQLFSFHVGQKNILLWSRAADQIMFLFARGWNIFCLVRAHSSAVEHICLVFLVEKEPVEKNSEKMRYIYSESLGLFFIIFNHYIILTFHIFKSYFVQSSK